MIKWLIKNTAEYRLETIEDVKQFEQKMREEAQQGDYTVSNFSYAEKQVKAKGEIIETYFQVKVTTTFNTLKEPEKPFTGVSYDKMEVEDIEWE